ncbi:hypothetical protein ABFS82_10G027500 [Erythranthe guttata]|uniref:DC1 domain-containing protein n=1 Tax=Erythranthe guttata TaxID=4155 RepID=A0A022RMS3_ERYGU|nr:PREDICTED: uncharacterized protein LOC105952718 [Erythranthe guttata]EYU41772.1 hypothetical protein MIMGU_mgv11b018922mg [Erythranthe guttata]|eukprot:XP_012831754.1 PREDICTED: uncharacterized protein LOC105952718 [Erythranthe guttata]
MAHFIFIHPGHPLTPINGDEEYLCDGCKTTGGPGKRFRCTHRGCDFDLHDYCATCPRHLTSYMHKTHALELMMRKGQSHRVHNRVCDICKDPVEGLFYRCEVCGFDVHPLCTQLPEKLHHALHKSHRLTLRSSRAAGSCAVCRTPCGSATWRYRCDDCNFDIHLECILKPVVSWKQNGGPQTNQRGVLPVFNQGIPYQPPPQFAPYYYYGYPGYANHPGFNHGYNYQYYNMQQNHQVAASTAGNGRKSMFAIVGQLGLGVISNMIFGVDLTFLC